MATYYVDLSQVGTGDGSLGTPFNFNQLVINASLGGADTYMIKGSVSTGSILIGNNNPSRNFIAWDLIAFGPWRINCTGFLEFYAGYSGIISGAIIYADNATFLTTAGLSNVFCKVTNTLGVYQLKGCTLICSDLNIYGGSWQFNDSVLDVINDNVSADGMTYNNCAFSRSFFTGTSNNCQFNWTPPTWPAWDASQSAFNESSLYAGIASPPQPGNSPYTGYETGLWGTPRNGLGAMDFIDSSSTTTTTTAGPTTTTPPPLSYFNVASASDNTSVTSTIDSSALISRVQSTYPGDLYFDTTSELGPVYVYYIHSAGRQQKKLVHDSVNHRATVQWSPYAQDGTWQKTKIKAFDKDGAFVYLDRTAIGTTEDLTHSAGTIFLNT